MEGIYDMRPIDPRPITAQERAWLLRGIAKLDDQDEIEAYTEGISGLVVEAKCDCGDPACHSVEFTRGEPETRTIGIACTTSGDGRTLIVHADERSGELVELELI